MYRGYAAEVNAQWFIGRTLNPRIGIFDIKTFKWVLQEFSRHN